MLTLWYLNWTVSDHQNLCTIFCVNIIGYNSHSCFCEYSIGDHTIRYMFVFMSTVQYVSCTISPCTCNLPLPPTFINLLCIFLPLFAFISFHLLCWGNKHIIHMVLSGYVCLLSLLLFGFSFSLLPSSFCCYILLCDHNYFISRDNTKIE